VATAAAATSTDCARTNRRMMDVLDVVRGRGPVAAYHCDGPLWSGDIVVAVVKRLADFRRSVV